MSGRSANALRAANPDLPKMTDGADSSLSQAARLTELETRYTHLQRTLEELDRVVISQARQIEQLERKAALLAGQLTALVERTPEERSLEDDKPPHY
jgi:SlyX protein